MQEQGGNAQRYDDDGLCVCIYIHMFMYNIHIYIHICVYIYICRSKAAIRGGMMMMMVL